MDYATRELTQTLQQIAAREAQANDKPGTPRESDPGQYSASSLTLPSGVDGFLETRRKFLKRIRSVSIGRY